MRRIRRPSWILWALALAACVACQATAAQVEYRTVGAIVVAVDAGMKAYADAAVAGKTSPELDAKVRDALGRYQAAAQLARVALVASNDIPPPEDFRKAGLALLQLLSPYSSQVKS